MDAQSTVARAAMLASLVRNVALYLEDTNPRDRPATMPVPLHWWLEKENHYQASHTGMSANFIKDEDGNVVKLSKVFDDVVSEILPAAERSGELHHIEGLRSAVKDGLEYERQRRMYGATGSLSEMLSRLSRELVTEVAGACDGELQTPQ